MEASDFRVVFVTAPELDTARRLAAVALQTRAAACANLIPGLESHYWWEGAIQTGVEVLIVFKTMRDHVEQLREVVLQSHPYTTPEFVALPVSEGTPDYLMWIQRSLTPSLPCKPL